MKTETASMETSRTPVKWRLFAIFLFLVLLAPAPWLARMAASKLEFFHLRSVLVEGTRYLTPEMVMERLALDTMRSVWDDPRPLLARLRSMPLVADAEISRRLPGTLVVRIREKVPVAFARSPRGMEAVDTAGNVLALDPSRDDLDLPLAMQRDTAILSLLGSVRAGDPTLFRRISEVSREGKTSLVLKLIPAGEEARIAGNTANADSAVAPPDVAPARPLRVLVPVGVSVARLADIFPVESDLVRRRVEIAELDLRYRDQVIARLQ